MRDRFYTARDVVQRAQEILDVHVYAQHGRGACLACGAVICPQREDAVRIFYSQYATLPLRRPGATQPELARGPRRVPQPAGGRSWTRRF